MKTTFSRIAAAALPGLFALLVIFAASAEAGGKSVSSVNTTAMGQSIRSQLDGTDFQFAIAKAGRLDLTGSQGHPSPTEAVTELRNGAVGGDESKCHLRFDNGVEAALVLTNPSPALPQPCGILGQAMESIA